MHQNHFFLIRHGESENNILEIDCSQLKNKDLFGLTEKGGKETELQAKKYSDFDIIFSSPFRRAKETALIFADSSRCGVIEHELLREIDVGDFELKSYRFSDSFSEKNTDGSVPFPNGESLLDAQKRVVKFLEYVNSLCREKKILVVTHGYLVLFFQELLIKNFNRMKAAEDYDDESSRNMIKVSRI